MLPSMISIQILQSVFHGEQVWTCRGLGWSQVTVEEEGTGARDPPLNMTDRQTSLAGGNNAVLSRCTSRKRKAERFFVILTQIS